MSQISNTKYPTIIAAALLLAFWTQAAGNLYEQSPVVDEPTHIARAQAYWRTGDFRLQRGHPPLIHALSGLAIQLEPGLPSPADLAGWDDTDRMSVARNFLWTPGRAADRIIFLARLPVLMLALILGALLFRWANQRLGQRPALVALLLFAFDPNLLAHSVLITTDMVATVLIFLAAYMLDRWMLGFSRTQSLRRNTAAAIGAGVALGLALTSKFSAVILGPVVVVMAGLIAWRRRAWRSLLAALAIMGMCAALVICLVYGFEFGTLEAGGMQVPAPSFWRGLLAIEAHNEAGHPAFLFGHISPQGWWYYFIAAFLLKTPLPTLLLLAASLLLFVVRRSSLVTRHSSLAMSPIWIILPGLYFLASLHTSINVGYRHVLPLVPFVILLAAAGIPNLKYPIPPSRAAHVLRIAYYVLFGWYLIGAVLIYPYHLAFFNELIGGPDGGYRALVDSNLDWGQDVRRLKRYLDANNIQEPYLTLFAGSPPEYYGINTRPLPGPYQSPTDFDFSRMQPAPGIYVIGASNLQGLRMHDPDTYDAFRRQTPLARVGHALFVYRIEEHPPLEKWAAACYTVDGPIDGKGIKLAFGRKDLRKIFYDCLSGWIYPTGGAPGWYIVPLSEGRLEQAARFLFGSTQVFHERGYIEQEAYDVYRFAPSEALDARLARLSRLDQAARVGPAALLGYTLEPPSVQRGKAAHLAAYWRAEETGQPLLSILAHLGGPNGLIATADGLAVPAETWLAGDVIVQAHTFNVPPDTPPGEYTIYLGMYSVTSGERLPAWLGNQTMPDGRLPVAILHVTE